MVRVEPDKRLKQGGGELKGQGDQPDLRKAKLKRLF